MVISKVYALSTVLTSGAILFENIIISSVQKDSESDIKTLSYGSEVSLTLILIIFYIFHIGRKIYYPSHIYSDFEGTGEAHVTRLYNPLE